LFYNLFFSGDALIGNNDLKKGEYVEVEGNLELKPYQSRDGSSKLDRTIYVKNTKKIEYSLDDNLRPVDPRYNNKSD
jgi:single-stranded DNA-binding protein